LQKRSAIATGRGIDVTRQMQAPLLSVGWPLLRHTYARKIRSCWPLRFYRRVKRSRLANCESISAWSSQGASQCYKTCSKLLIYMKLPRVQSSLAAPASLTNNPDWPKRAAAQLLMCENSRPASSGCPTAYPPSSGASPRRPAHARRRCRGLDRFDETYISHWRHCLKSKALR
jgi:hypothetical protein